MIKKIISGGQTGADQAALDAAIELGIMHGGWVPKGRLTESGPLPDKYRVQEMPDENWDARTEQNVIDSDGTLIVSHGELAGGSAYTEQMAATHGRPCAHIDLEKIAAFAAVKAIQYWLDRQDIQVLNVAGARQSKDPKIYDAVKNLLKGVFFLDIASTRMPGPQRATPLHTATVEEAVQALIATMPLRDKTDIARMSVEELRRLHPTLGRHIRTKYGLGSVNRALMTACRARTGVRDLTADQCSRVILTDLWEELRRTHRLRAVK